MSKRVNQTPEVLARLSKAVGKTVVEGEYAVYECVALNTLPLRQKGTLFNGAVVQQSVLTEMSAVLQNQETIPIQLMHDNTALPVGRAFWGETTRNNLGRPELKVQFFVSTVNPDIIAKVDDGTVDEVSVGFSPKSISCSKCGFDFLGPKASFENVWSLTCDKGHEVGKDGTYTGLSGLSMWHELSLVGKGAANGAKILPQTAEQATALAASGYGKSLIIQLTATKETTEMSTDDVEKGVDPTTVNTGKNVTVDLAQLTGLATAQASLVVELASAKSALEVSNAKVIGLESEVAKLKAELEAPKTSDTEATLAFLKDQAAKLNVALGQKDASLPETSAELVASINLGQAKLSSLLPVGGVSKGAVGDSNVSAARVLPNSAFKLAR